MENQKYSIKKEVLRFLIVGVIATIADYLTKILVVSAIGQSLSDSIKQLAGYASGFTVGVILNYVLSTFWVFKNVKDDKKAKSLKSSILFLIFALIGFGIGLGIFYGLGALIGLGGINIFDFSIFKFYESLTQPAFYLYTLVFAIQTLIVLFWNYWSRKKWIYIAPDDDKKDKKEVKKEVKEEPQDYEHLGSIETQNFFREIFRDELNNSIHKSKK